MRIERTAAERELRHEDRRDIGLILREFAKLALRHRIEVIGQIGAPVRIAKTIKTLLEGPNRRRIERR